MKKIRVYSIASFTLALIFGAQITQSSEQSSERPAISQTKLSSINKFLENTKATSYFQTAYVDLDSMANKGNLFAFEIILDVTHRFSDQFGFQFEGGGAFEKGNSDSLFDNNPIDAENRLLFKRAEFKWDLNENFTVMAGAISSKSLGQHLLLSHRGSLLGTKQIGRTRIGGLSAELSAIQAIPTNKNHSSNLDEVDEGNPEFFLETLSLAYGSPVNFLGYQLSHFAFNNLSNSAASASRYIGNSTYVFDKDNAEFIYSYQGWSQNIGLQFGHSSLIVNPFANFVENTAAPENNKAHIYGLRSVYTAGEKSYEIVATQFRAEADATVGYYQSKAFFHVNHEGRSLSLIYNDNAEDLMVKLVFGQMKEININQLIDRDETNTAVLLLRKSYDLF